MNSLNLSKALSTFVMIGASLGASAGHAQVKEKRDVSTRVVDVYQFLQESGRGFKVHINRQTVRGCERDTFYPVAKFDDGSFYVVRSKEVLARSGMICGPDATITLGTTIDVDTNYAVIEVPRGSVVEVEEK